MPIDEVLIPPQNLDAERSLLGSILLAPEVLDEVIDSPFDAEHLYLDANKRIYRAVLMKHEKGRGGIDPVTLAEALQKRDELDEVGGIRYLHEIIESVPHALHARHYADIVTACWTARETTHIGRDLLHIGYANAPDLDEQLNAADHRLAALIANAVVGENRDLTIGTALLEAFERIDNHDAVRGLACGYESIDHLGRCLKPGTVTILAARTHVGKSAVCLNIAHKVLREGHAVLIVSLEMSRLDLADRLLAIDSGINLWNIQNNRLNEMDRDQLCLTGAELGRQKLFIDDAPDRTISKIAAVTRLMIRKHQIELLIVDYLQLVEPDDRRVNREQQVAGISRGLKLLSRALGIAIICPVQLNREVEHRDDRKPRLSDIRESGAIEQNADAVWLVDRPYTFDEDVSKHEFFLWVAKNRNGRMGEVQLNWNDDCIRLSEVEPMMDDFSGFKVPKHTYQYGQKKRADNAKSQHAGKANE